MTKTCTICDGEDEVTPDGYCDYHHDLSDFRRCESCGHWREDLDDADICTDCRAEQEHLRQLRSDYYASR